MQMEVYRAAYFGQNGRLILYQSLNITNMVKIEFGQDNGPYIWKEAINLKEPSQSRKQRLKMPISFVLQWLFMSYLLKSTVLKYRFKYVDCYK